MLDKISDFIEDIGITILRHYLVSSLCSIIVLAITLCIIVPEKWLLMVVCSLMAGWFVPAAISYILLAVQGLIWVIKHPVDSLKHLAAIVFLLFGMYIFTTAILGGCSSHKKINYLDESENELKEILSSLLDDSTEWRNIWASFDGVLLSLDEIKQEIEDERDYERACEISDEIKEEVESIVRTLEDLYSPEGDIEDAITTIGIAKDESY